MLGWGRVARVVAFTRGNLNPMNAQEPDKKPANLRFVGGTPLDMQNAVKRA